MKFLIVLLVVLGAAAFLLAMIKVQSAPDTDEKGKGSDYEALRTVLSPAEQAFIAVLAPVLPEGVGLLVKIRLADIFTPKRSLENARRVPAANRLNRKHVDFLLVRTADFSPLAGVELDDAAKRGNDSRAHDAFLESVFVKSGLPLIRIRAQESYDTVDLGKKIATILAGTRRA